MGLNKTFTGSNGVLGSVELTGEAKEILKNIEASSVQWEKIGEYDLTINGTEENLSSPVNSSYTTLSGGHKITWTKPESNNPEEVGLFIGFDVPEEALMQGEAPEKTISVSEAGEYISKYPINTIAIQFYGLNNPPSTKNFQASTKVTVSEYGGNSLVPIINYLKTITSQNTSMLQLLTTIASNTAN